MPGTPVKLGPFEGGLHNSGGSGDFIEDTELFVLDNLEVDLDKTLANRPAVQEYNSFMGGVLTHRIVGVYIPEGGTDKYLCVSWGGNTRLMNAADGTAYGAAAASVASICAVQYNNRMWVIPAPGSGSGGYFDNTGAWTAVAAIPKGEAVAIYQDRMFIAAGITSTSNSSRLYWSEILDPTTWSGPGGGSKDVEPGNGEKLTNLVVLNQDLVLFKEHSTFRFGYSRNITSAETTKINSNIGNPGPLCAAVYNNNSIYVLHDNSVYELYNFTYTKMSQRVTMNQVVDPDQRASSVFGLTLFRDRIFVRYYANMYVYNLRTATWSTWTTARPFAWVFTVPSLSGTLDTAFAAPSINTAPSQGRIYFFRDDRKEGVGGTGVNNESFVCSLVSKTYDFDVPQSYKALFHWGVAMATNGNTTGTVSVPSTKVNPTWDSVSTRTWTDALAFPWDDNTQVMAQDVIPPERGPWARKYLKIATGKRRFRQIFFSLSTDALASTAGDAAVRIYDMTSFMLERETVFKRTS